MSISFPEMRETCTCSGGMNESGIRRGRGTVWKWMDGRIVKEDVTAGARSVVPWIYRTTETSDEGHSIVELCIGGAGECSHGSRGVGSEGRRSRGARIKEREEVDLLGFERARTGRSDGGRIGGIENEIPLGDVLEGKFQAPRGPDSLPCETESAPIPGGRDRCRVSYMHFTSQSLFMHVEQGRLASHF